MRLLANSTPQEPVSIQVLSVVPPLNGVQEVASSNLAGPTSTSKESLDFSNSCLYAGLRQTTCPSRKLIAGTCRPRSESREANRRWPAVFGRRSTRPATGDAGAPHRSPRAPFPWTDSRHPGTGRRRQPRPLSPSRLRRPLAHSAGTVRWPRGLPRLRRPLAAEPDDVPSSPSPGTGGTAGGGSGRSSP